MSTGQATAELTPFKRIIGIDPGEAMLQKAQSHIAALNMSAGQRFEFKVGSSEDLSFLPDNTVDLAIAGNYDLRLPLFLGLTLS